MTAVASFEKRKDSFESNVLAMVPLGFVVGREAELASEVQVGIWNKEDVPTVLPTPNSRAHFCFHEIIVLPHIRLYFCPAKSHLRFTSVFHLYNLKQQNLPFL